MTENFIAHFAIDLHILTTRDIDASAEQPQNKEFKAWHIFCTNIFASTHQPKVMLQGEFSSMTLVPKKFPLVFKN